MKKITQQEFNEILEQHKLWLDTMYLVNPMGKRADFSNLDLGGINMVSTDCSWADFTGATLKDADCSCANFTDANLADADCSCANFKDTTSENCSRALPGEVENYRLKVVLSGKIMEVEAYPVWNTKREAAAAKQCATRQAQRDLNERNAKKRLIRKINTNFTDSDLALTLTYKGTPPNEEQAKKDITNYIRRVRALRRKQGLPEMKYVYVMEFQGDPMGKPCRIHHHILMSAMDRDVAEQLWQQNGRANARRLQSDDYGYEGMARYMMKDPKGSKRWGASQNLKDPIIKHPKHKLTKRKAAKIASDEQIAREVFEKQFKGYAFNDIAIKHSDYVSGVYMYVRMVRRD